MTTTTTYNHEIEIGAMKVVDLRRALKERQLSAAGVKKVLQQRLREAVALELLEQQQQQQQQAIVEQQQALDEESAPVVEILEDDDDDDNNNTTQKNNNHHHKNDTEEVESNSEDKPLVDDDKATEEELTLSSPETDNETSKELVKDILAKEEECPHNTEVMILSPSGERAGESMMDHSAASTHNTKERVVVSDTATTTTTTDTAKEESVEEPPQDDDDDDEPIVETTNNVAETTPEEEEEEEMFFDATDSPTEASIHQNNNTGSKILASTMDNSQGNKDVPEGTGPVLLEDSTNLDDCVIASTDVDVKEQDTTILCVPIEDAPLSPARNAVASPAKDPCCANNKTVVEAQQCFIGDIEESPSKALFATVAKNEATAMEKRLTKEETPNPPPTTHAQKTVSRIPKPSVKASKIPKPSFSRKSVVPKLVPKSSATTNATAANNTTTGIVPSFKASSNASNASNRAKKSVLTQHRPSLGGSKRASTKNSNVIQPEVSSQSRPQKSAPKLSRAPLTAKTNQRRVLSQDKQQSAVAKTFTTFKARPIIAPKAPILPRATAPTTTNAHHLHWTKRAPAPSDHQVKTHNRQAYYWCRKCQLWNTAHGTKQHFGPGIRCAERKKPWGMTTAAS